MSLDPFPSINKVIALVLQEQKHRENTFNTTAPNVESIAALIAKPMKTSTNALKHTSFHKKKLVCSHCEYIGHTSNKCYRIHGFCTGISPKGMLCTQPITFLLLWEKQMRMLHNFLCLKSNIKNSLLC